MRSEIVKYTLRELLIWFGGAVALLTLGELIKPGFATHIFPLTWFWGMLGVLWITALFY